MLFFPNFFQILKSQHLIATTRLGPSVSEISTVWQSHWPSLPDHRHPFQALWLPQACLSGSKPANSSRMENIFPKYHTRDRIKLSSYTWGFKTVMPEPAGTVGSWTGRNTSLPAASLCRDPLRVCTFKSQNHCKATRIEFILFSFHLATPFQIFFFFNSC